MKKKANKSKERLIKELDRRFLEWKRNHIIDRCPSCRSRKITFDAKKDELTCKKCGVVFEEGMIDVGRDWIECDKKDVFGRNRRTK